MIGAYKQSKFLAEREVKRLVADAGIPVIIVQPTAPLGPVMSSRPRLDDSLSKLAQAGCRPM